MIFLNILLAILTFKDARALYEDQIHKWDWRQRFIGIDVDFCLRSATDERDLIFCATGKSNTIAALNHKGDIVWRNVQERQAKLHAIALTSDDSLISIVEHLTLNETTLYLRKWSMDEYGHLQREKLVNLFSEKDCFYNIDSERSAVQLLCNEQGGVHLIEYSLAKSASNPEEKQWPSLVNHPNNIKFSQDCTFVENKALVCLKSHSLHFLQIGSNKWQNQPLPEVLNEGRTFILDPIIDETGYNRGFFGVSGSIDRKQTKYYLYHLEQDKLQLKRTMEGVDKVSLMSNSGNSVWVYISSRPTKKELVITQFTLEDEKQASEIKISSNSDAHSLDVHKMFPLQFLRQNLILITFADQRLAAFDVDGKLIWSREESMSAIIWSGFVSLPYFSTHPTEYDFEWNKNDLWFINSFIKRIQGQLTSFQSYLTSLYQTYLLNRQDKAQELKTKDELISDRFGFHKLIFVLTKRGKILIIDSLKKGFLVHSFYDSRLRDQIMAEEEKVSKLEISRGRKCDKVPSVFVFQQRSDLFNPLITLVTKEGYILAYNPLKGKLEEKIDLHISVKQSLLMQHADEHGLHGIVIMDESDKVYFYPKSSRDLFINYKDSYYMVVGRPNDDMLQGFGFHHLKEKIGPNDNENARRVWSFTLPHLRSSCLSMRWRESEEHVHSQGKVLADRAVLYKYLNPNLVAIIQKGEEKIDEEGGKVNVVNFYLLDAITGAIYYSVVHRKASDPVHLLHSENFILYSFYNEKHRRIEISSLELFEGKESPPAPPPVRTPPKIVEHISFIFPTGIKATKETRTIRGITNKHILIALSSGGVLSLPRVFLDPRRASLSSSSKYASSAAAMEEGGVYLPPYIPELPIPSEGIVNYNQSLVEVDEINVGVSSLESTCLLFITGLDIYYTRVTPSKTFDILKDDFDHLLIIIVLSVLVIFSVVTKYLASRKSLNASWK